MNLVEEKQKVGKQESTTSIKSILEKTLQREEIEIKYNCNPCNKLFNNRCNFKILNASMTMTMDLLESFLSS